jgi:3-oxoacyl-[acyl-carrier protein] reductase
MSLAGKTALVTGGSKGIGKAISLHLASLGCRVIVNYSSSSASADEVVSQINSTTPNQAIAIQADAGSVKDVTELAEKSVQWGGGKLDILIACAGVMKLAELDGVTESDYDAMFNLNVKGVFFLTQVCLPSS